MAMQRKEGFVPLLMRLFSRLDTNVLEEDFLVKFAKFAHRSTGLATAKHFASYLHLPVDHPKATRLFHLYDSVSS